MAVNLVAAAKRGKARRSLPAAALICGLGWAAAVLSWSSDAAALTGADSAAARAVMADIDRGKWDDAHQVAARAHLPVLGKLVDWLYLTQPGTPASFDEITPFIDAILYDMQQKKVLPGKK